MGYSMKMGSKEINSPSAFSMKQSAMMMHHDKKLVGIKTEKTVTPNPPREGYHTTGNRTTYRTTSTFESNSGTPPYQGSQNFQIAFGEARKRGDKTFTFNNKSYTTELAPPSSGKNRSIKVDEITATGVGIKKYKPTITASILDRKIDIPGKVTPGGGNGGGKIKKKKKRKKLKIKLPQINLPRIQLPSLRLGLFKKCPRGGCPHIRTQFLEKLRRKNRRKARR